MYLAISFICLTHLLQELSQVVVVEGECAHQQGVQDDPAGPDISPRPVILLTLHHTTRESDRREGKGRRRLLECHYPFSGKDVLKKSFWMNIYFF